MDSYSNDELRGLPNSIIFKDIYDKILEIAKEGKLNYELTINIKSKDLIINKIKKYFPEIQIKEHSKTNKQYFGIRGSDSKSDDVIIFLSWDKLNKNNYL
jgi:hypothetical protein